MPVATSWQRCFCKKWRSLFVLLTCSASVHEAGGIFIGVAADSLPWLWTPIMSGVGLAPNATLQVQLRTDLPSPSGTVVLLNEPQLQTFAPLGLQRPQLTTYMQCTWRASLSQTVNASFQVRAMAASRYSLGILQLHPGSVQGLEGEVAFVNPGGLQLPLQQRGTPLTALFLATAFLASAALLLLLALLHRRAASRLHALLLAALLTKGLALLLMGRDLEALATTGRRSLLRHLGWQLMRQLQLVLEVVSLYAVALGWKVVRSYLRQSEWAFVCAAGAISFFLGTFEVACSVLAACASANYLMTQFTVQSLCFLIIIIATNFNIFTLQRQMAEALAAPETSALYAKHRAYCWFRGAFLYYIVVPAVTNFLAVHVVSWDAVWMILFMREGSLWIVYTMVLWLFRPGFTRLRIFDLAVVEASDSDSQE